MVIDIIGAPGAGKTTICNRIIRQLEENSIPYLDMTGRKDTPVWIKLYIRACMLWVRLSPQYRHMYNSIEKKLAPYPKTTEKFFHSDRTEIMKDVVRHVFAHRLYEGKKKYLINDEGILHKMLPISIQHGVPIGILLEIYQSFHLDMKLIYVSSSIKDAYKNNQKRNRHACAYDEMNDDDLYSFLEKYFEMLHIILENLTYEEISINSDINKRITI